MANLFVSYRGNDRSRVKEIIESLKTNGLCHNMIEDVDLHDLRGKNPKKLFSTDIEPRMAECQGSVILIGDDTHSSKITLTREIDFAKTNGWYIFGLHLSGTDGNLQDMTRHYSKYVDIPNTDSWGQKISKIVGKMEC